jgi:hypothetical protein
MKLEQPSAVLASGHWFKGHKRNTTKKSHIEWDSYVVVLGSLNLNPQFSLPAPTDRSLESVGSARKRRITQSVRDEVVRLYASGRTALEVAEHCGIGKTTVLKIVKAAGLSRPQGAKRY